MNNCEFGALGEKEAMRYLVSNGYDILSRNFRVGRMGELDIVGKDGDAICFIEVKTRSSTRFGTPAQAVVGSKQATIKRLAMVYLQRCNLADSPVRFDVVELLMDREGNVKEFQLIKNAF